MGALRPVLAWCCLLCCLIRGITAAAAVVSVGNEQQLLRALRNQTVTRVELKSSIQLSPGVADEPIPIKRNLTITSSAPGVLLDWTFRQHELQLQRGVLLTFKDLTMTHVRYGAGVGYLDFLAYSPLAAVLLEDVVMLRQACVPSEEALAQVPDAVPYPGYPGQQSAAAQYDGTYCADNTCFQEAITYNNVSLSPALSDDRTAGGYGMILINTTKACRTLVTAQCLADKSADECVAEAIDASVSYPTPGKLASEAQHRQQQHLLAVILGPVLAGVGAVVLIAAVSAVFIHQRRQQQERRRAKATPTPQEPLRDTELATLGDMGARPKASSGPLSTSGSWEILVQRTAQNISSSGSSNSGGGSGSRSGSHPSSSPDVVQLGVLLGAGSFGRVYKGSWRGREVAVKVISHSSKTAALVMNEVNLMLSFNHPNIVRALHVINWVHKPTGGAADSSSSRSAPQGTGPSGQDRDGSRDQGDGTAGRGSGTVQPRAKAFDDAQIWIVQEYCNAGTLADAFLDQGAPLDDMDRLRLLCRLLEVAQAMSHLHARNVIHGDLKTANVLLATCGRSPFGRTAKVTDFGISRVLQVGQTHRSTRTLGTVSHMSPELLRTGRLSAAADVYAFGVMMWELTSGKPAFSDMHYGEVVERVGLRGERPPVPENTPEAYALLMASCWQEQPAARPSFPQIIECLQIMLASLQQQLASGSGGAQQRAAGTGGTGQSLLDSEYGPQDL